MTSQKAGLVVACLLFAAMAARVSAETIIPAPISQYSFQERAGATTVTDNFRGNAGKGTIYKWDGSAATVTSGSFGAGIVGKGMYFDGSTYVTAPLVGAALSEYTLSAWVKLDSWNGYSDAHSIVKNWADRALGSAHLGTIGNSWANYVGTQQGSWPGVFSYGDGPTSVSQNVGKWTQVITTVSGSAGEIKLYMDGGLADPSTPSGAVNTFSGNISDALTTMAFGVKLNDDFSGPSFGNEQWLRGWLDEITFWDKALTPDQVSSLYTSNLSGIDPIGVPEIDPAGFGSVAALVTGALGLIERRRLKARAA